jgi:hypothetical protein
MEAQEPKEITLSTPTIENVTRATELPTGQTRLEEADRPRFRRGDLPDRGDPSPGPDRSRPPPTPHPPTDLSLNRNCVILTPKVWRWQAEKARALGINISQLMRDVLDAVIEDPDAVEAYLRHRDAVREVEVLAARAAATTAGVRRKEAVGRLRPRYERWTCATSRTDRDKIRWIREQQPFNRELRAMDPLDIFDLLEGA